MAVSTLERVAVAPPRIRPRGSLERAASTFASFLAGLRPDQRQALLCHGDADGLASGVILCRALERTGHPLARILAIAKGESAWSAGTVKQLAPAHADALLVVDLGSRPQPIYPGVPTLLIDHHRSLGVPPAATLISSFKWRPSPCTADLAYWLSAAVTDVGDLDWMAAIGIIGDQGPHATLQPLPQAEERYGRQVLEEATGLLNAARQSATGDPAPALAALLEAREPADIAHGRLPQARELARLREDYHAALTEARQAGPTCLGAVALIRVHSPYLVHPALARIWRSRLPEHIILVANESYLPGRVSYSLGTDLELSLAQFMQAFRSSLDSTEFGYGHDRTTGGTLSTSEWKRLLATLGFH